jgi:ubiquitin-protein ligase
MAIRDNRLANDYRALQKLCAFNEPVKIKILEQRGNPPDYYRIQLSNCNGVESVNGNTPKYRTEHIILISNFPESYPDPGQLPDVIAATPLFHPNVYPKDCWKPLGTFCFQGSDLTTVSQPLDALVKRVISMIQYQNLRFGAPANGTARDWANSNQHLFPLRSGSDGGGQSKHTLNWR